MRSQSNLVYFGLVKYLLFWCVVWCSCTHERWLEGFRVRVVTLVIDDDGVDGSVNIDDDDDAALSFRFFLQQLLRNMRSLCQPFLFVLFFMRFFSCLAIVFALIPLNASIIHWKLFGELERFVRMLYSLLFSASFSLCSASIFICVFVLLDYPSCTSFFC